MHVDLRKMVSSDLDQVLAIEKASFPTPWTRFLLEGELQQANSISTIAEQDGEVQAYLFARLVADELHIINIAVSPGYRRKGLARMLLNDIFASAESRNVNHIYLEVRKNNLAAIRLYRSYGFKIIRIRQKYYEDGSDAYEMGAVMSDVVGKI